MSKIEAIVIQKILQRAEIGKAKYGVTMERKDLSMIEWLTHLQEELMDAAVYIEKLIGYDAERCSSDVLSRLIIDDDDFPLL
jgi:hypothetical protein